MTAADHTPNPATDESAARVERYLDARPAEDLIDWNGGGAGPELLASDLRRLLAALAKGPHSPEFNGERWCCDQHAVDQTWGPATDPSPATDGLRKPVEATDGATN